MYSQTKVALTCTNKSKTYQYNASHMRYFQFYDLNKSFNRYFSMVNTHGKTAFYELLLGGKIPLYRKSYLTNNRRESNTNPIVIYMGNLLDYLLYFLKEGEVIKINDFDSDVLPLMKDYIAEISSFIVDNQLDINLYSDQISIVDYYNSLSDK